MDLSLLPQCPPATLALLQAANLVVHPNVARVVLHGSRGLRGGARPNSDLDLSLLVDTPTELRAETLVPWLSSVLDTTRNAWQSDIALDLAVVFETRACGLRCFTQTTWQEGLCTLGGRDCFGLYKTQRGFSGLVVNAGIEVRRMYPCLEIWRKA